MVVYLCIATSVALLLSVACGVMIVRTRKEVDRSIRYNRSNLCKTILGETKERLRELEKRLEALEKGAAPDYEKAKAAAKAVNDFNDGIAAIMNFDPYEQLKINREENAGGERQ